ncbi:right-handed parallel beta-helix repeat-containing protein [Micromonospora humi]|uniref:Right handed beta helix region n=1 Tax=Micromonospora humi TaxID=745366 RepID=A0A1C5JBZ6_9ACTN|nr:right-handed parallel beta-helix repeat-containing protein [Micromonospora humi]SCG68114.1 Right handed beta helix region [Micromonospora humi]
MNDLFVAAGPRTGDGSRERPFHDPWVALRYAEPGDRIHVAAGAYTGRLARSSWVLDCPDLTVLGGYGPDFATRTPWRTPTILGARAGLRVPCEPNMIQGVGEHDRVVLDGLFLDAAGRNEYDEAGAFRSSHHGEGPLISLRGEQVTVRNCVFANGGAGAAEIAGNGGRFENNLVVNFLGSGLLTLRDSDPDAPIVVAGNSFCFAHDDTDPPRGAGADRAIGLRIRCAATITDNLFVGCGNAAIACYHDIDRITVDRNQFFCTLRDVVRSRVASAEAEITEEYAEELADVGLASAVGNVVADPHLSGLPARWVDAYTTDTAATYARPPVAALNTLRAAVGLGELPTGGDAQAPVMRRLTPSEVLAIGSDAAPGHHPVELPAPEAFRPRPSVPAYRPVDWARLTGPDEGLSGTPVEIRAGLGFDQNVDLLSDVGSATHVGVAVYEPGCDDRPLHVLCGRYSLAHRQVEEAARYSRGLDVELTYLLRGTYRADLVAGARQGATLVLDAITPAPAAEITAAPRPAGSDWYVRAGSSGGDGRREAPFRDPFQALEKAAAGDRIHVAEGEYAGRLRSGAWRIPVTHLTMLGGYTADFATRDPWRHPVRFVLNPETRAKGVPGDPVLTVEGSCDGLVLDGFVFDGSTYNAYTDGGALDVGNSQSVAMLDLRAGSGTLEVRNCVFTNAAYAAVQISGGSGVFRNNVVVNTSGTAVRVQTPGAGPWVVRDNTILFAADPTGRASTGQSTSGCLLEVGGRALVRVESNVLGFADGVGVRVALAGQNLRLDGNVVAANRYADVFDSRNVLIDPAGWERAVLDAPFGSLDGNRADLPALPVDETFARTAVDRLALLPAALPTELLRAAAAGLGVSHLPGPDVPLVEAVPASTPAGESSVSDLLAGLGRARAEFEARDAGATETPAVVYCPVYPVTAALALAVDAPTGRAGARALPVTDH